MKKKHSLLKSQTAVKWRDMASMRSNVCPPKHKKRRDSKTAKKHPCESRVHAQTSQGMITSVLMPKPMWLSKAFAIKSHSQSGG